MAAHLLWLKKFLKKMIRFFFLLKPLISFYYFTLRPWNHHQSTWPARPHLITYTTPGRSLQVSRCKRKKSKIFIKMKEPNFPRKFICNFGQNFPPKIPWKSKDHFFFSGNFFSKNPPKPTFFIEKILKLFGQKPKFSLEKLRQNPILPNFFELKPKISRQVPTWPADSAYGPYSYMA